MVYLYDSTCSCLTLVYKNRLYAISQDSVFRIFISIHMQVRCLCPNEEIGRTIFCSEHAQGWAIGRISVVGVTFIKSASLMRSCANASIASLGLKYCVSQTRFLLRLHFTLVTITRPAIQQISQKSQKSEILNS